MDTRTLIAILLIFVIYIVFLSPKPKPIQNEAVVTNSISAPATDAPALKSTGTAVQQASADTRLRQAVVMMKNNLIEVALNGLGQAQRVQFLQYAMTPKAKERMAETFSGNGLNSSQVEIAGSVLEWSLVSQNATELKLQGKTKDGLIVQRTMTLPNDSYSLRTSDKVINSSGKTIRTSLAVDLHRSNLVHQESGGFWQHLLHPQSAEIHEALYFKEGDVTRTPLQQMEKTEAIDQSVITAAGYSEKYFFFGLVPTQFSLQSYRLEKNADGSFDMTLVSPEKQIAPGATGEFEYAFYMGPKNIQDLRNANPELEQVVDYGSWIGPISRFLLGILHFFYKWIPNYGVGIILLTILVKLALYPLAFKSAVSMRRLQQVQPKMKAIRDRYKEDKTRMNAEMMNLYKSEKVNPVGGCLPLLLQMPVFFALYRVFFSSIEFRHAPFFGWIRDLSAHDPYFVTPILMTGLMWLQQKLTPMPPAMEENEAVHIQRQMMKWMPIIFGAIMIFLPAGLTLYFLVNAMISIAQQVYLNKHLNLRYPLEHKIAV